MDERRKHCSEKCARRTAKVDSPRLAGRGPKKAKIVLVGEAPGQQEDEEGLPFIGPSGQLLNELLDDAGIDRKKIYITNAVKCATPGENQKPLKAEITECRRHLIKELQRIRPNVIGALGAVALESVLKRTGITKLQNNVFYSKEFDAKVVPLLHPAYILRNPGAYETVLKGIKIIKKESTAKHAVKVSKIPKKWIDASTPEKIDKVIDKLERVSKFAVDLETTSLDPRIAKIILVALSFKQGLGITIPWKNFSESQLKRFRNILLSNTLKIGQGMKFDIRVFRSNGIKIKGPFFDTLPAVALINENMKDKGLEALTLKYLDLGEYWSDLEEHKKKYIKEHKIKTDEFRYSMLPHKVLSTYAQGDADATFRLYKKFKKELKRQDLYSFYKKYTMPIFKIMVEMEHRGIKVDREKLAGLIEHYSARERTEYDKILCLPEVKKYEKRRIRKLKQEMQERWEESRTIQTRWPDLSDYFDLRIKEKDWRFNPGSTKQLREILYEVMGLTTQNKTNKGLLSTDERTLNELAASPYNVGLAKQILEHRWLVKYLKTYLISVYEKSEVNGRIHPGYHQHRTVTGRLASSDPNFQNVPRDAKDFKSCFVADPGKIIIKADLAQAEFRCWAHYANDKDMLADIESGLDIHRVTASEVFGIPEEEITKEQRTVAKTCVFGTMYGRGSKAIAEQFGISKEEASGIQETFFNKYPKAKIWLDKQVQHAREYHYVQSWLGRVRRLPEIVSDDHMVRAEAERQAKNAPIQSLASDMNNHYMVRSIKLMRKNKIKCFPMATVHDANFIQVEKTKLKKAMKIMQHVVATSFPDFRCKMMLDFEVGKTLGTLKEVSIDG